MDGSYKFGMVRKTSKSSENESTGFVRTISELSAALIDGTGVISPDFRDEEGAEAVDLTNLGCEGGAVCFARSDLGTSFGAAEPVFLGSLNSLELVHEVQMREIYYWSPSKAKYEPGGVCSTFWSSRGLERSSSRLMLLKKLIYT